jgi:uncharacterized protein (TIGR02300 family)
VCFKCGSKFYDLNRPDPVCPKCGADQRERPKQSARHAEGPRRAPPRPMAPLLDDEEEVVVVPVEEDLEIAGHDIGDDDFFDDEALDEADAEVVEEEGDEE